MTTTLVRAPGLGDDVVGHLDAQIASARRLLSVVLRQGQSIRAREVEEVMARLADIQAEMGRRAALEGMRTAILTTAGTALGRSEERRVGKECSLTCRSRWSPYH